MSKLKHSKEQAVFAQVLQDRYGLTIPKEKKNNSAWIMRFLELFSFDTYLPPEEAKRTGWYVINAIKEAYYWGTDIEQIARKQELHVKDVEFIIETLSYGKKPLHKESIEDPFPDVTELEKSDAPNLQD